MTSLWLRICNACNGLVDTLGSCCECSEKGHQEGHFLCEDTQDEIGYHQVFSEQDNYCDCRCQVKSVA